MKFYGIEIRALRTFEGTEGVYYEGTVFYNGKKLGQWLQDPNGGESKYRFDTTILNPAFENYKSTLSNDIIPAYGLSELDIASIDTMLEAAVYLKNRERDFRVCKNKGYAGLIIIEALYVYTVILITCSPLNLTKETVLEIYHDRIEEIRANYQNAKVNVFLTKEDFIIQ